MTRQTASNRIEKKVGKYSDNIKRNVRFELQRTFGTSNEISHTDWVRFQERILNILPTLEKDENELIVEDMLH